LGLSQTEPCPIAGEDTIRQWTTENLMLDLVLRLAYLLTLDELCFDLSTGHKRIWRWTGEVLPEKEKHMIQATKIMITIIWNALGFHVVDVFPKHKHLMWTTISNIFWSQFSTRSISSRVEDILLFMQIILGRIPLRSPKWPVMPILSE
jgi:hypothetical protein